MILKEDQRSCLKIECARCHNARQCYEGLQEACGECALPYHTVAKWVKAFKGCADCEHVSASGPEHHDL